MSAPAFAASLMCLDWLRPAPQLEAVSRRADAAHCDVMDGHFAPNLALSPDMLRAFRPALSVPMQAHLMATDPERWLEPIAAAGADGLCIHLEAAANGLFRMLGKIRALNLSPGLALCPATPLSQAEHALEGIELLNLMTVDVGYAGQALIPQTLRKVEAAREMKEKHGYTYVIQVDGAANRAHFAALRRAGAEQFVLGSALFGKPQARQDMDAAFGAVYAEYEHATGERIRHGGD